MKITKEEFMQSISEFKSLLIRTMQENSLSDKEVLDCIIFNHIELLWQKKIWDFINKKNLNGLIQYCISQKG